jgi:hypothetical protein
MKHGELNVEVNPKENLIPRFWSLLGMGWALMAMFTHPGVTRITLHCQADWHIGIVKDYIAVGVEAAWLADDYRWQQGLMMMPNT